MGIAALFAALVRGNKAADAEAVAETSRNLASTAARRQRVLDRTVEPVVEVEPVVRVRQPGEGFGLKRVDD